MIRKLARRVLQLIVDLVRECVEKDWSAQVVLQLLPHIDTLVVQTAHGLCLSILGAAADWIWEKLGLHLGFEAPTIDIVFELNVLLEHLRDRRRVFLEVVKKFMLFLLEFLLHKPLLQLHQMPSIVLFLLLLYCLLLCLEHLLVELIVNWKLSSSIASCRRSHLPRWSLVRVTSTIATNKYGISSLLLYLLTRLLLRSQYLW